MSNSVIGALRVMLGMDTAEFEKGATSAQREIARLEKKFEAMGGRIQKVGVGLTAALTAPLAAFAAKGIQEAQQSAAALAQVEAALASMGPVAGRTSEQLTRAADAFEGASLFEADEILKQVTANMLTFGNVSGENFDRAQQAAINLATRMDGDLKGATLQVGKALNDPIKGITALSKAGIQFTDDQKAMIAALVETGNVAGAQTIILRELERQFGGAAQAAQNADPFNAFSDSMNNLAEAVGDKLLPKITPFVDWLTKLIGKFAELPAPVQDGIVIFAGIAAAVGPVMTVFGSLVGIAPKLVTAFGAIRVAATFLMAHPAILGFAAVLYGIYVAWQNWDKITDIVSRLYTGVKAWLVDKLGAVFNWLRDKIKAVTGFFFDMYDAVVGNSYVPDMVEGIGREFQRLQGLMVDPAQKATQSVTEATRQMAADVAGLLDRLFPQFAEARRQAEELKLLDAAAAKGLISDDLRREGRIKVLTGNGKAEVSERLMGTGPLAEAEKVGEATDRIAQEMAGLTKRTEVQTVRIAETFQQMADRALGGLRRLADGIKSGNFLSILEGVIGIGTTLGGLGLFGKKIQTNIQKTPGFANGGAMRLGGLAGIDRNVLSLNGSPIARVSAGETMQIRPANDRAGGGASRVHVTVGVDPRSGNITAFVTEQIAAYAPAIAGAGAAMAQAQVVQRTQRRVR